MAEAGELGHVEIVGAMNEQAGDPRIGQLVEWARPIQERHFHDTRAASLELAKARTLWRPAESAGAEGRPGHHPPWPPQPAHATVELNTMAAARPLGLELDSDPLLHYSARQDALIWRLQAA
jgi:hypothetical protein